MTVILVRHDRTNSPGLCYGQTDIPSAVPYERTAESLRNRLPVSPDAVMSSPLSRCLGLANALYPYQKCTIAADLQEVHFGVWENTPWAKIPEAEINRWSKTPTDFTFPEGESLRNFKTRVQGIIQTLQSNQTTVVFTHAGVIRLWLAVYLNTPWKAQLNTPVPYAGGFTLKSGTISQL